MGNNSHRSDPGNSQVESTDDKWEKLQKLIPLALKIQANASAKLVGIGSANSTGSSMTTRGGESSRSFACSSSLG